MKHRSIRAINIPSSANHIFDRSIFENHMTTSAILGEVMRVTSAPVNWAKRETFHKHTLPEMRLMNNKNFIDFRLEE